jgi:hypothetical protein
MNWHVSAGGAPIGPLSENQVITMLRAGLKIVAVAYEGAREWSDPRTHPPFAEALSLADTPTNADSLEQGPSHTHAASLEPAPAFADVHPSVQPLVQVTVKPAARSKSKLGQVGLLCGSLCLGAALAWWAAARGRVAAAESGKAEQSSRATAVPGEARSSAQPADPCDVEKLWFMSEELTPSERQERVTHQVEAWPADCRFEAMNRLCRNSCEGMLSDLLVAAAVPGEREVLAKLRADTNRDVTARGRASYKNLTELAQYALSIVSSPRTSNRDPKRAPEPESAAVASDSCLARMAKDFARVDDLRKSLDGEKGPLPAGGFWLAQALTASRSCLDCGDDRSQCAEMNKFLKSADEDIREHERKVEADKKLGAR